ncbi:MAG: SCO1664 family protein [Nitriliruptoraceae bacterium]
MTATVGPVARRLVGAPIEVVGQFTQASNATLLVRLRDRDPRTLDDLSEALGRAVTVDDLDVSDLAVHKPARGERPLWDFPDGTLHRREVAAFEVSEALGWDLVPTTVLRDGPYGPGSLQRFVPHDPGDHWFTLVESDDPSLRDQLRRVVVFDLVIDNADRKAGHVLLERVDGPAPGRVRLVDHGVSLHVEHKLRTVAWEYAGQPVAESLRADVGALAEAVAGPLAGHLAELLTGEEVDRLVTRAREVAALEVFPEPTGPRPYPWPLV